ncbi:MAG: hypothetical protein [Bacteriophage sp.]|nr:MAG: hypothetical protein [Bacteriophage sp.]
MTLEPTILDLLFQHTKAFNDTTPAKDKIPIAFPNVKFKPPDGNYLEVRYLPNSNRNFLIGNDDPTQHIGILQITVITPLNVGQIKPYDIAGELVEHFKKGTQLQRDDVIVTVYSKPSIAPAIIDNDRFRVPVSIQYQCIHE